MADKVTIQVTPSGYLIVTGSGVIPSGTFSIVNCELKQSDGSSPTDGLYTLKRDTLSTLFINQKYSDIINGATGLAFTSIPTLNTYISSNFSPSIVGGGGTPGGSTTQMQYNNAGVFGGTTNLSWNNSTNTLNFNATQGTSPTIAWIGDSVTLGTGPVTPSKAFVTQISNTLNYTAVNLGVGGATASGQTGSNIPTYTNQAYLVIEYGINDLINLSHSAATFQADLTTYVGFATAKGWPTNKIILLTIPGYLAGTGVAPQYFTATQTVATNTGTILGDIYTLMANGSAGPYGPLTADGTHPSNLGSDVITQLIIGLFTPLFNITNQAVVSSGPIESTSIRLRNFGFSNTGYLAGVDRNGNLFPLNGLPDGIGALGSLSVVGKLYYSNGVIQFSAFQPSGAILTTDIITKQASIIWSANSSTNYGNLQLFDGSGITNINNAYSGGAISLNTLISGSLAAAFVVSPVSVISNLPFSIKQGAAFYFNQSNVNGYGRVQPFDGNGNFNISNSYVSGVLTISLANGVAGGASVTQMAQIGNSGRLILQLGGTFTDVPSARFVVNSTTEGILPPRMTTTQKNAIGSPAEGLLVYDITLHKLYGYDGSAWQAAW